MSNTIRLLALPEEMIVALAEGKLNEGHTRPLLMLAERPEEQTTLFKDILLRRISVREAERISRHIATDKVRKWTQELEPEILELERSLARDLGTRVQIEKKDQGGRVLISFFTDEDLRSIVERLQGIIAQAESGALGDVKDTEDAESPAEAVAVAPSEALSDALAEAAEEAGDAPLAVAEEEKNDDDLYSIKNFTI